MKKILVVAIILLVFQKWGVIENYINPPPDYAAAHNGKVILYATSWCGFCKKTRELLRENNIDYFEYDIEKSEEGNKQYRKLGGGGVPVLLISGKVIKGYDPAKILALAKPT